ncbi:hypothetical protein [Hoylesella loescheii]|uniref:Uncharacterized protein n=1 Tax=Hoylesella loescheii DSM 19665 = JCM 12249 = ATCC 15930 TaxID=1122985 RepID=A0A069QI83_HOYLO|nr:hypothetical protein [Hoylesella loescheii]KDR51729.1 hypothetical protein HMPREF1991_02242 [Hoylesella loescheii DSM 19665 = JCM 12249 = ATCC 15930]
MKTRITIKKTELHKLYKSLTTRPNITREYVEQELASVFGKRNLHPTSVKERIQSLNDAIEALGYGHPYVIGYMEAEEALAKIGGDECALAFFELRIIVAALNEGWKWGGHSFCYLPMFELYPKDVLEDMTDDEAEDIQPVFSRRFPNIGGMAWKHNIDNMSLSAYAPACLMLKNESLARYAAEQFMQYWAKYILG